MNIEIDFEGAIARALAPEALAPVLDKHINSAINSAISDATGYNSEFQKALKVQLTEVMPKGLSTAHFAKFQHILNAALSAVIAEENTAAIDAAMKRVLKHVMPDVPTVLKLSKFMESAREGLHKEEREPFYAHMEQTGYGTTHIYLDGDEHPSRSGGRDRHDMRYSAENRLSLNGEGEVYALKLNGKEVAPTSLPCVVGAFDAALMSMYVGRTRLEIDMDDDDLESLSAEQYD